jgi:hypothetical protein
MEAEGVASGRVRWPNRGTERVWRPDSEPSSPPIATGTFHRLSIQPLVDVAGESAVCCRAVESEEVAVPVVAVFQSPSFTQEQYEEITRRLTGGKSRMESRADWPVEGLLVHVTGQGESGFRVVDVWESEDAFRRFGETLMPILQEVGLEVEPEIYPAHAFVSG